jgi:two-component system, cell cycle response regulator
MLNRLLSPEVIARLPTPKGVALALTKACQREDVHLETISGLVRTDPALSGRLLGLANSAASGGRALVSVDEAVSRMGISTVNQVALAFSLIDQYSEGHCTNFNYAGFWNQSLLMAAASQQLGTLHKLGPASELFTVGLLAQVGNLALATAFPQEYSDIVVADVGRLGRLELEESKFEINHLNLSIALMEHWGIPSEYARPFGLHEEGPSEQFNPHVKQKARAQLAHAAWNIAGALTNEGVDALFDDDECVESLAWLDLSREALLEQLTEVEAVWQVWLALISRQS